MLHAAGPPALRSLRRDAFSDSRMAQTLPCCRLAHLGLRSPLSGRRSSSHKQAAPSQLLASTNGHSSSAAAAALDEPGMVVQQQPEDKWVARTLTQFRAAEVPASLQGLHASSWSALSALRMPSTRNEEFRYTDITPLLKASLQAAPHGAVVSAERVAAHTFPEASNSVAVVVDGVLRPELSQLAALQGTGVYVGGVQGAPTEALQLLGSASSARGNAFAVINGAVARDALVVVVPQGVHLAKPLLVLHLASGSSDAAAPLSLNAPRLLLHAGADSSVELVEEYVTLAAAEEAGPSGSYFTCGVAELSLGERANVKHAYVQREAAAAVHVKATLVNQAASSEYTLTEVALGGSLTRHDLAIQQDGAETQTTVRHFLLCGAQQLHDLHSKIVLDHPKGLADQLHKCIVSHSSGRGVFDGNVQVKRRAQKTDAKQLSRSLLLAPRATINVKPNLQIVADDVQCTHGAAISDLAEEELFYFRARGIDAAAARRALVISFGAEVVQHLGIPQLAARVQADISRGLAQVDLLAAAAPSS